MFKLISVTNRALCTQDFLGRIQEIAENGADGIILREKDLHEADYQALAAQVLPICQRYGTTCILHSYPGAAEVLGSQALHLPLPVLRELPPERRAGFSTLGCSCHSMEDVEEAEKLGCTYVTLGHIFATDCKKGLPPRGLELLRTVCANANLPVYAIGGIGPENLVSVRDAGAAGACIMSGLMRCADAGEGLQKLREALKQA